MGSILNDRVDQAKEMAKIAFEALEDKKGENVCAIDISAVSVLADYFVIANGNSDSQVRALVENVEEKMHKAGYAAKETEGHRSGAWVLIDFGDVIVHIFDRENRQFYNLERIWNDGKRIDDVNEFYGHLLTCTHSLHIQNRPAALKTAVEGLHPHHI